MKKILILGLITALCLSGCGSKPAESKTESKIEIETAAESKTEAETESKEEETESKAMETEAETTEETESKAVDITGKELFSITVGDETLDLTTCTIEQLFKLLQKAGIDTGVPGGTNKPYGHDLVYLNDKGIAIGYYNPYNEEKPWAESRIDYFSIDEVDEKSSTISLVGGKIKVGEETVDKYIEALEEYGIEYDSISGWLEATQVVNDLLQEGTMEITGNTISDIRESMETVGSDILKREIIIPSTME